MSSKTDAIAQCEMILELIEDEVSDSARARAQEFFDDVQAKVESVRDTIERTGRVTEKQAAALDGWEAAVRKWIR